MEYSRIMMIGQRKSYKYPTHCSVGDLRLTFVKASSSSQGQKGSGQALSHNIDDTTPAQDD